MSEKETKDKEKKIKKLSEVSAENEANDKSFDKIVSLDKSSKKEEKITTLKDVMIEVDDARKKVKLNELVNTADSKEKEEKEKESTIVAVDFKKESKKKKEQEAKADKEKAKAELVEVLADAIHRSALDALHSRNNKYHPFVSWNTQERDGRIQSCGIDPAIKINIAVKVEKGSAAEVAREKVEMICLLAGVAKVDFVEVKPASSIGTVGTSYEAFILVDENINKEQLVARFKKTLEKEQGYAKMSENKLNGNFAQHAPANLVQEERDRLAESQRKIATFESYLKELQ